MNVPDGPGKYKCPVCGQETRGHDPSSACLSCTLQIMYENKSGVHDLKMGVPEEPTLIILSGEPGSGKSTVAKQFPDYVRISQDELGSRKACMVEFKKAAREKRNIIVDRCNHTRKQREPWIHEAIAHGYEKILCFRLVAPEQVLYKRIIERKDHPTIKNEMLPSEKYDIIMKFFNEFEEPSLDEGFSSVVFKRS